MLFSGVRPKACGIQRSPGDNVTVETLNKKHTPGCALVGRGGGVLSCEFYGRRYMGSEFVSEVNVVHANPRAPFTQLSLTVLSKNDIYSCSTKIYVFCIISVWIEHCCCMNRYVLFV